MAQGPMQKKTATTIAPEKGGEFKTKPQKDSRVKREGKQSFPVPS